MVDIDGGYVRDWDKQKRHFEMIVGKSTLAFKRNGDDEEPSSKCLGFAQTFDTNPKQRLYEVLKSQGSQMKKPITFLSDGGNTVHDSRATFHPEAEHILEWFHISMKLTVEVCPQN